MTSAELQEQKIVRQLELLAEVAHMYYEQDMTQAEIANRFLISRSKVSRLLSAAKEKGIVTVTIQHTGERSYELEQMLERKYHLKKAYVLNSNDFSYEEVLKLMGQYSARYISSQLKKHQTVGISWGKSIAQTIEALQADRSLQLEIAQIIGGTVIQNPVIDVPGLTFKMIQKFNAKGIYLNAPLYMSDGDACCRLKEQPAVAYALDRARNADLIVTGIGEVARETFAYMYSGFDNSAELAGLQAAGAVGFMCAQAYDIKGRVCAPEFNRKIIGLTLEELKRAKQVIAVSGGRRKGPAILGALRGGFMDVLVTDVNCVDEIIRLERKSA